MFRYAPTGLLALALLLTACAAGPTEPVAFGALAAGPEPTTDREAAAAAEKAAREAAERLRRAKPEAVDSIDLEQYMGKWYEVARTPNSYQRGTVGTIAHYQLKRNGRVSLKNTANRRTLDGRVKKGSGTGKIVRGSDNAKWDVTFVWPFTADYWIIECCPDYSWAVVGQPSKKNLWILSRSPKLDEETWTDVTDRLARHGYDKATLQKTPQPEDAPTFEPGKDGTA